MALIRIYNLFKLHLCLANYEMFAGVELDAMSWLVSQVILVAKYRDTSENSGEKGSPFKNGDGSAGESYVWELFNILSIHLQNRAC